MIKQKIQRTDSPVQIAASPRVANNSAVQPVADIVSRTACTTFAHSAIRQPLQQLLLGITFRVGWLANGTHQKMNEVTAVNPDTLTSSH